MYDVANIRKDFPILNNKTQMQNKPLVYLDNAATTLKPQCVIDAINEYYTTYTSNSHRGDYDLAYKVDTKIDEARNAVAKFINCDVKEVVFTSGATDSLNLVALSFGDYFLNSGDEILLEESAHASNLLPWFKLAKRKNAIIKFIPLDMQGKVTPDNLSKVLSKKTKIVALTWVSNVLGYTIDIDSLSKLVHSVGAVLSIDGAQAVPHMPVNFRSTDIDFLSFSAHKMCGPTGVGCLIGKYDLLEKMDAFELGGGMNMTFAKDLSLTLLPPPSRFEAGTMNIAGIIGFKTAIDYINSIGMDKIAQHDKELHDYVVEKLINNSKVKIYNADSPSGIFTFNIDGVFPQDEASLLNSKGIAIRTGEHCAKILKDFLGCQFTCRMSTYLYTSKEDVDKFIDAVNEGGDILDAFFN